MDKKLRVLAPLVHDPAVVRGSPAPSLHDTEIVHGSSKAHSHMIRGTSTASVEGSAQQLPTPLDEITVSVVGSTPSLEYYWFSLFFLTGLNICHICRAGKNLVQSTDRSSPFWLYFGGWTGLGATKHG